jgi:hypothetical protein
MENVDMSTTPNRDLPRHYEGKAIVGAPIEDVFGHIDDHSRLSSHMNRSSWVMGGGRMEIQVDEGRGQQIGSKIRLAGTVCGLRLSVEEIVTERAVPYRKTWKTIGHPRLLIIGHYQMGFELSPDSARSILRVFINYALPDRGWGRWLGILFANFYARWCTEKMLKDTVRHFRNAGQVQLSNDSVDDQPLRTKFESRR